ncbi:MAG: class I SAM-dependent methyltransferase [Verrucomicrobia bacterium]|nr:class I SAM-dependent methyltransferase [Verrucomicrobiota bacterium]
MNTDEYLKLAEVEDRMWYFRSLHAHVARALAPALAPGAAVLDAGCGTGGLILRLRAAHPEWRYAGIDFMPIACDLARRRCGPDVDLRVASITELPFAAGSFDAVVSADVICQVDHPGVAMAEFFRVLRPGGVLFVNVPAYMWMWSYHDDSCQTKHRYTRPEIAALLRDAGFGGIATTHWNALPFPVVWAKRKLFRTPADTSDVKEYPRVVDRFFGGLMALEHAWMRGGGTWAWGTSVSGCGRKPPGPRVEPGGGHGNRG